MPAAKAQGNDDLTAKYIVRLRVFDDRMMKEGKGERYKMPLLPLPMTTALS